MLDDDTKTIDAKAPTAAAEPPAAWVASMRGDGTSPAPVAAATEAKEGEAGGEATLFGSLDADQRIRAVPGEFRLANPWANRESLPIHVHAEAVPPPASPAAWVASIGPKGYETDNGYLTRAHPPVPSEQDQWSYVSAHRAKAPPAAPRVSSAP